MSVSLPYAEKALVIPLEGPKKKSVDFDRLGCLLLYEFRPVKITMPIKGMRDRREESFLSRPGYA